MIQMRLWIFTKVAFWSFESIQRILAASLNMLAALNIKKGLFWTDAEMVFVLTRHTQKKKSYLKKEISSRFHPQPFNACQGS